MGLRLKLKWALRAASLIKSKRFIHHGDMKLKKLLAASVGFILFIAVPVFVYLLTNNRLALGYNQNYKPEQPIPFSHEQHVGQYKIDCQMCHTSAERSRHASIPSLNICMNCHMTIKPSSPYIQKLQKAYEAGQSISWVKVHRLPDHVKFNHAAHVLSGKQCQECHGPVETMPVIYQWSDLSMGWCVNCHRRPENKAPLNCATCHY